MGKYIKPFLLGLNELNEDSFIDYSYEKSLKPSEKVSVNPDEIQQMKDVHKERYIKSIEEQLKTALKEYWKNKKEAENIIIEAKNRLDINLQQMYEEFEKAVKKLDSLGIEIKNDEIELDELVIVLRQEEKMYELTDKDKSELFDIFVNLNKKYAQECINLAKSMDAISEVTRYTEYGLYPKKSEGSKRFPEAYYRQEIVSSVKETNEMNESFASRIFDFFKSMGDKIKNYIFNIETTLEEFDELMSRAKKIVKM
jgi:hypothetical protein